MISSTLRHRFDDLRKAMQWSWKDIDSITGRKNARTNIAKTVPAWSRLAIVAHECYEVLLRHHFVVILLAILGRDWQLTLLSNDTLLFIDISASSSPSSWIELEFQVGAYHLKGNTTKLYEVLEQAALLYPSIDQIEETFDEEGEKLFVLVVPIVFDQNPTETLKGISQRSKKRF